MNFKKAIRLLLIILIIVLFLTILRSTYSKYVTSYDKQTGVGVLGWNIKVNNQKIVDNATFTNNLRINLEHNEHIADNVIAPTQQGTVDLVLDSTGTQVPYQYEIQIVEGNVDYESTADNVFVDSWLNNGNKIYQMSLVIDYSSLDSPIWYQASLSVAPWYENVYNPKTIEFTLPEGFSIINNNIYEISDAGTVSVNGTHVTVVPGQYDWLASNEGSYVDPNDPTRTYTRYASNKITLTFQTIYNGGDTDLTVDEIATNIALDGKKIYKTNLPDYKIYAYSINGGEKQLLQDNVQSIIDQVQPANDITTPVITNVKLYVEWYDGVDNIMDNAADVAVSKLDQPYGTVPIRSKRNANRFLIYK